MYKIIVRGIDPVFVDDEKGQKIWLSWTDEDRVLPAKLVIGNTAFYSADIRNIHKIKETEAEKARQVTHEEQDYVQYRKRLLALSVEERAERMIIPNMLWNSVSKQPMPEELKKQIVERQKKYFSENPKCVHANPKVYRELIPKFIPQPITESMTIAKNVIPTAVLRLVENIIQTDLRYSIKS